MPAARHRAIHISRTTRASRDDNAHVDLLLVGGTFRRVLVAADGGSCRFESSITIIIIGQNGHVAMLSLFFR